MAAGVTTTAITTPEGRFTADVAGAAGAPLVLLLHGFPQSRHSWREQIPALSAVGYSAVPEHRPLDHDRHGRLNVKTRQGVPTGPAGIRRGVKASGRGPTGAAGPRRARCHRGEELHAILRLADGMEASSSLVER